MSICWSRSLTLCAALSLSCLVSKAHAVSFTFTPSGANSTNLSVSFSSDDANQLVPSNLPDYEIQTPYVANVQIGNDPELSVIYFQVTGHDVEFNSGDDLIETTNPFLFQSGGVYYFVNGSYAASLTNFDEASGFHFGNTQGNLIVTGAATPEPSSFALLGTGLLGAVGVLKRRLA